MPWSNIELLNNIVVYFNRYLVPLLYIIGNVGTLLSVFVFLKKSWRKNVCVFYFLICLLINLGYINSSMVGTIFTFGLNINAQNSSMILCKLFYYVSYLFAALLPTSIILASIDRLLLSSQNIDTRLYSSKRLAYFSIGISTFFWIIFYSHTLIKVNIYQIYPRMFLCYYETSGFYFEFILYSTFIIAIGFDIVLITLSILTLKNVRQIRLVPRQQRQQFRAMHRKDFQLLRCLYVHNLVYIVFNIFLSVYHLYLAVTKNQTRTSYHQAVDRFLSSFAIFLHHIPHCASFFIFISVSKAFRQELKRLILQREEETTREQNVNIQLNVVVDVVTTIELPN